MACTITITPSTGSSDWTGWITQQGLTDRGFMQISLTNPATTAASLIGTGSVFELAGSIYSCTETAISLATGTASAAVAVYYVAIPSAGGTTCTFEMNSVAPTWVDAKQGYYASAASTSRYLGGSYINAAAGYDNKFLYTPQILNDLIYNGETRPILKKRVSIGEWNMDATDNLIVLHGLGNFKNVKSVSGLIKDDSDANYYPFYGGGLSATPDTTVWAGVVTITGVTIYRKTGGQFDGVLFNGTASTVANRGFIFFEYEA